MKRLDGCVQCPRDTDSNGSNLGCMFVNHTFHIPFRQGLGCTVSVTNNRT